MAKNVFIYGDKVINEKIPDAGDMLSMIRFIDKQVEMKERERTVSVKAKATAPRTTPPRKNIVTKKPARRPSARRLPFHAKVLIHKNDRYVKGRAVNISKSGIFVESLLPIFKKEETVNLSIRSDSGERYNVIAKVTRFNAGPYGRKGYGLQFVGGA
jgi:hypothetical protein